MAYTTIKAALLQVLRDYIQLDLRLSHLILGISIVIGGFINLVFAHGWTIWPLVLAFGILTYMNEAVSRSGEGIPPFKVYALFFGAIFGWIALVLILSSLNPLILIIGVGAILYRVTEAVLRQRERDRLIAFRRTQGLCLHCGEVYDPNSVLCDNCGEEPNPDAAVLKRVAQIYRGSQDIAHAREILERTAKPSSAAAKEQALLARHHTGKVTAKTELPKAAKLGPQRATKRRF